MRVKEGEPEDVSEGDLRASVTFMEGVWVRFMESVRALILRVGVCLV